MTLTSFAPRPPKENSRPPRNELAVAVGLGVALVGAATIALLGAGEVGEVASSAALLVAGGGAFGSCWTRSRRSTGRRRRAWTLLTLAAAIAVIGNLVTGTLGPSSPVAVRISDLSIASALLVSIAGLLHFPPPPRYGAGVLTPILDGLAAGAAVMIIASSLIYSDLLATTEGGFVAGATVLAIPILDVLLATTATILVLRSGHADRQTLGLIAAGYLAYMLSDLHYAVQQAQGAYAFGTWTDLGWILGYVLIAIAAWVPPSPAVRTRLRESVTETIGTVAIFAVLLAASVVQIVSDSGPDVQVAQLLLWMVLIAAACGRQVLLTRENFLLREDLERRVAPRPPTSSGGPSRPARCSTASATASTASTPPDGSPS